LQNHVAIVSRAAPQSQMPEAEAPASY
jgi:hypothetical protein